MLENRRRLAFVAAILFCPLIVRAQFDTKPAAGTAAATPLGKSETHKWEFGIIVTAKGGPCAGLSGTTPIRSERRHDVTMSLRTRSTSSAQSVSSRSRAAWTDARADADPGTRSIDSSRRTTSPP